MPAGDFGLSKVFSVSFPPHNTGNVDAANRGLENVASRWNIFVILLSSSLIARASIIQFNNPARENELSLNPGFGRHISASFKQPVSFHTGEECTAPAKEAL